MNSIILMFVNINGSWKLEVGSWKLEANDPFRRKVTNPKAK
ncbi:MAG: hypothetical protein NXI20_28765 [bacterium]|nr:hypothetical protein [bacterium]